MEEGRLTPPDLSPEAWEAMAAFLADAASHGGANARRVDTHTAMVALVDDRAWKLRRPVNYGWLDYGTRAQRRHFATREIELNSVTARKLYIGLGGILAGPDGFRLVPPGKDPLPPDAEPCVVMHRFPADALFDRRASEQRLTPSLMHATGRAVAEMHKASPPWPRVMRYHDLIEREIAELAAMPDIFPAAEVAAYGAALRAKAARRAAVIDTRTVRRCHGDLHLGNIVMWNDWPTPFDCIEFNDDFAVIDPLYDIAFLLMDLEHRGLPRFSSVAYNAWAERLAAQPGRDILGAYGGAGLLPLCKAIRAAVRAKVGGLAARHWEGEARERAIAAARRYLREAEAFVQPRPEPCLIAVGGLSGSGKSTLARALAPGLEAVVLRSDAIRKGLRGVDELTRLPVAAYTREASQQVYGEMLERAALALRSGANVILDAAHLDPEERGRCAALAADLGLGFAGFWLDAPIGWLKERIATRRNDVSDANAEVVDWQSGYDLGEIGWHRLPADAPKADVAGMAKALLAR